MYVISDNFSKCTSRRLVLSSQLGSGIVYSREAHTREQEYSGGILREAGLPNRKITRS